MKKNNQCSKTIRSNKKANRRNDTSLVTRIVYCIFLLLVAIAAIVIVYLAINVWFAKK